MQFSNERRIINRPPMMHRPQVTQLRSHIPRHTGNIGGRSRGLHNNRSRGRSLSRVNLRRKGLERLHMPRPHQDRVLIEPPLAASIPPPPPGLTRLHLTGHGHRPRPIPHDGPERRLAELDRPNSLQGNHLLAATLARETSPRNRQRLAIEQIGRASCRERV